MSRRHRGRKPRAEGWRFIASIAGRPDWLVYSKPGTEGWLTVKLVADGRVTGKANYWLSWNGERFGKLKDAELLHERYADTFGQLEDVLREQDALDLL